MAPQLVDCGTDAFPGAGNVPHIEIIGASGRTNVGYRDSTAVACAHVPECVGRGHVGPYVEHAVERVYVGHVVVRCSRDDDVKRSPAGTVYCTKVRWWRDGRRARVQ